MVVVRSKAPLRVSLAGGGTDVSPYPEEKGGAVLNCTIDKFAYATLEHNPTGKGGVTVQSLDYNLSVNYEKPADLVYNGELDLVKAALKILHPAGPDGATDGSLSLFLHSDAPPGTGLGSSSTICVALVGAFQRWLRQPWSSYQVAELVAAARTSTRRRSAASTSSSSGASGRS
jgi:D-glycero-alpha-D-manno-heptose-7-phosphate kinase